MKAVMMEPQPKPVQKLTMDMKAAARGSSRSSFDSDEVQMYLAKLTNLVPNAPKHRKLSKLEVIQCVIDYICDLEDTLMSRQVKSGQVLSEKQNFPTEVPSPEPEPES